MVENDALDYPTPHVEFANDTCPVDQHDVCRWPARHVPPPNFTLFVTFYVMIFYLFLPHGADGETIVTIARTRLKIIFKRKIQIIHCTRIQKRERER